MKSYLDILKEVGPSVKEMEKVVKDGAKEEIAGLKDRIETLKENPAETYNQPLEPQRWTTKEFDCAAHDVADILAENLEDEAAAIKGYTEQINRLRALLHTTQDLMLCDGGPEKSEKRTYLQNIIDWVQRNIEATQEKIEDELNHSASLTAEYIEFTGIRPAVDGIKEVAETISAPAPAATNTTPVKKK